jgi:hypothetical protein
MAKYNPARLSFCVVPFLSRLMNLKLAFAPLQGPVDLLWSRRKVLDAVDDASSLSHPERPCLQGQDAEARVLRDPS